MPRSVGQGFPRSFSRSMPQFAPSRRKTNVNKLRPVRLWNAKRQIEQSHGLAERKIDVLGDEWRSFVSRDVVEYIDKYEGRDSTGHPINELSPAQKSRLLESPSRYFSRPQNVPLEFRKQVTFPDFTITLLRTPHLGAYYASFEVPLWFGKLDLKSYLTNLYKVETLHIRSFVVYQKPSRTRPAKQYSAGMMKRTQYRKRMTVQLEKPFMWPAEITRTELDNDQYESSKFWKMNHTFAEVNRKEQDPVPKTADLQYRKSIAQQARDILLNKESWGPTWKQLSTSVKVMESPKKISRKKNPPKRIARQS